MCLFGGWENVRKCEKMWATSKKCVFYGIFKNTTKHQKIFSENFFEMQPNTWKHFLFRKIAFPENIYFLEMLLHEPNAALVSVCFSFRSWNARFEESWRPKWLEPKVRLVQPKTQLFRKTCILGQGWECAKHYGALEVHKTKSPCTFWTIRWALPLITKLPFTFYWKSDFTLWSWANHLSLKHF